MSYGCRWDHKSFSVPSAPTVTDEHWRSIFGHDRAEVEVSTARPKDMCQRHDFEFTKKLDKVLGDFRTYKNPKDREKIKQEYFGRQQEYRNKVVHSELKQKYG